MRPGGAKVTFATDWNAPMNDLRRVSAAAVLVLVEDVRVRAMQGGPVLWFLLNGEGRARLAEASTQHVGKRMALFVDGKLYSAPLVRSPIPNGELELWGGAYTDRQLDE